MKDLCIDMQDVYNASLILWFVAIGLDVCIPKEQKPKTAENAT